MLDKLYSTITTKDDNDINSSIVVEVEVPIFSEITGEQYLVTKNFRCAYISLKGKQGEEKTTCCLCFVSDEVSKDTSTEFQAYSTDTISDEDTCAVNMHALMRVMRHQGVDKNNLDIRIILESYTKNHKGYQKHVHSMQLTEENSLTFIKKDSTRRLGEYVLIGLDYVPHKEINDTIDDMEYIFFKAKTSTNQLYDKSKETILYSPVLTHGEEAYESLRSIEMFTIEDTVLTELDSMVDCELLTEYSLLGEYSIKGTPVLYINYECIVTSQNPLVYNNNVVRNGDITIYLTTLDDKGRTYTVCTNTKNVEKHESNLIATELDIIIMRETIDYYLSKYASLTEEEKENLKQLSTKVKEYENATKSNNE